MTNSKKTSTINGKRRKTPINRLKSRTITPLNIAQQQILELFAQEQRDLYLALIEKKLPFSHSWIQTNLKKLVIGGFLQETGGVPHFYTLTAKSRAFLDQGVGLPDIRTHGIEFTIPIIQKPIDWDCDYSNKFIKISDEIRMKNWKEEITARWKGNFIRISDSSISIFLGEFWNPNVELNLIQAHYRALEFCRDMEQIHPRLRLGQIRKGSVFKLSAQEHAIQLPKNSRIEPMQGKTFVIDWSKGYPELEFKDNKKSADHMARFSHYVDSIARGEITIEDVQAIREVKRTNDVRRIVQQGIRYAKILWLQRDHKPPYTSTTQVPGYPTAEQRKKWDAALPKILRRDGPDVYATQNQTKKTGD